MRWWQLLIAATLALISAPIAAAQEPPADNAITWSVSPADEDGADGRRFVEHELDPGQQVTEHMAVTNHSATEVRFGLQAADGFRNRNGRFDMLTADKTSVAAGSWIRIPDSVTVAAGQTRVISFQISVPEDGEPGDFAAGVAASVLSVQQGTHTAHMGVDSRIGFPVMLRVAGDLMAEMELGEVEARYLTAWNPVRPGAMVVEFTLSNQGNTRLRPQGVVEVAGSPVAFPVDDEPELLPGESRHYSVQVEQVWPLPRLGVHLTAVGQARALDGTELTAAPVAQSLVVWQLPWPQTITLVGAGLLLGAAVRGRIRSRRELRQLLNEAREEGRRQALAEV